MKSASQALSDFMHRFSGSKPAAPPPPPPTDWATPTEAVGAGLGAAGLWKADKDLSRIQSGIEDWVTASHQGDESLVNGLKASENYARKGREVARMKVLGMPIPYLAMQADAARQHLFENPGKALKDFGGAILKPLHKWRWDAMTDSTPLKDHTIGGMLRPDPANKDAWGKAWRRAHMNPLPHRMMHYWKYYSPKFSDEALRHYATLDDLNYSNVSQASRDALLKHDGRSIYEKVLELGRTNKQDFDIIKPQLRERAFLLGGAGPFGGGIAHTYAHGVGQALSKIQRALHGGKLVAGGAAAALLSAWASEQARQKTASHLNEDDRQSAMLTGVGAGLSGSGVHELARPNRVGFTWSEVPQHGAGHSTPGKALLGMVEELRSEGQLPKNTQIELALRNKFNHANPRFYGRMYDTMINTGMGIDSGWAWQDPNQRLVDKNMGYLKITPPKSFRVRPGGYVGYVTDLGNFGPAMYSYDHSIKSPMRRLWQALGVKDHFINFGPKGHEQWNTDPGILGDMPKHFNVEHVGEGFPTMTATAHKGLSEAHALGREGTIARALADPELDAAQKELLGNLGEKKLLFVTGSGRGDFVGARVRALQKELRRRGLQDKVLIAAGLGSQADTNPISRAVRADKSVLSFARMPQHLYVGLPGVADYTWGSSGTSAGMESEAAPGRFGLSESAHAWRDKEIKTLERLARRGVAGAAESIGKLKGVDVDDWNRYNKKYWFMRPGVDKVQSAADVVNQLFADSPKKTMQAQQRGLHSLEAAAQARQTTKEMLGRIINEQNVRRIRRGVGRLGGGVGLMGAGLYPIVQQLMEASHGINPLKPSAAKH